MSWKRIKSFLIVLFVLINIYLISSTHSFNLKSVTKFDEDNVSKTVDVIHNNYGIEISRDIIPSKIVNLRIIDVDNILFSQKANRKYKLKSSGKGFELSYTTNTFSYSEKTARLEIEQILKDIGIEEGTYKLKFFITDKGLVCKISEQIKGYPIFNGRIRAEFSTKNINISGAWYFTDTKTIEASDTSLRMSDITGVLVDVTSLAASQPNSKVTAISNVDYGYYVSSYDENVVSKSASAVPCYMIETDIGSKYYYDATNGKLLKQEG